MDEQARNPSHNTNPSRDVISSQVAESTWVPSPNAKSNEELELDAESSVESFISGWLKPEEDQH